MERKRKRERMKELNGKCKDGVEGWDCEHYDFYKEDILERKTEDSYNGLHCENEEIVQKHSAYTDRSKIINDVFQLAKKIGRAHV